jgi:hypothetical protein
MAEGLRMRLMRFNTTGRRGELGRLLVARMLCNSCVL